MFLSSTVVNYRVEADTGRKRNPRVRFQDIPSDTFTGSLTVLSSRSNCHTLKLNVLVWCRLSCRNNVPQPSCVTNKVNPSMSFHSAVSSDGQIETRGLYSECVLKRTKAWIQPVLAESGLLSNSEPWSETLWINRGSYNSKLIQPEEMWCWWCWCWWWWWWWFQSVNVSFSCRSTFRKSAALTTNVAATCSCRPTSLMKTANLIPGSKLQWHFQINLFISITISFLSY